MGGVALASTAAWKLWQHVQDGERQRGEGTALGWVLGIVAGSLVTVFSLFVGLASLVFTGGS